ncbi:MAG: DUF5682 family protein, partial [Ktedonobacterales bacterium]
PAGGRSPADGRRHHRETAFYDPAYDPLAVLAEAAGYSDHELWWERQIEQRHNATGLFEGILEAMTALRADLKPRSNQEAAREAYMRQTIRRVQAEGYQRIAIVCGAWHSPALGQLEHPDDDADILKNQARVKVEATWIPWTNSRLAYRSGYGAGVASPGWYTYLWQAPENATVRWVAHAAQLLREHGLDASSAAVIEAVRLSDALAAMGELPMPGLNELHEAIQTVLCNGSSEPMQLIREKLEIGEAMGEVPSETPMVPLQRDLEAHARHLKLKQSPEVVILPLDLRNDTDRARSQLLHRLSLLDIRWGEPQQISRGVRGTFHENWKLKWEVEFVVQLIVHNIWGNTIENAAVSYARSQADAVEALPVVTALLERAILAGLPTATEYLLARVQSLAAVAADVRHLMDALPALGQIVRYGDVRRTKPEQIEPVIDALFARVLVGLPKASISLDDDAAEAMEASIDHVQETIDILNHDGMRTEWLQVLLRLVNMASVHGLVRGRGCRLLLEQGGLNEAELQRLAGLALSPAVAADQATAWVEGILGGSGLRLLQQDGLWRALDAWLVDLAPETFVALLPLLRRAFSGFQAPERRAMGEKVAHMRRTQTPSSDSPAGEGGHAFIATANPIKPIKPINRERADIVVPVLAQILGAGHGGEA